MEVALLADERTDLVSTNRLGDGWAYQKLDNQQVIFRAAGCKGGWVLGFGCQPIGAAPDFIDQCCALNFRIKSLNVASILSIILGFYELI